MAELSLAELDIQGQQDNWATFPISTWTNTLGYDIQIKNIYLQFVGADQLIGEFACWLVKGTAWPPQAPMIASFGAELYSNPILPVTKPISFGEDYITIPNNTAVSLVTNAGPVNLPNGTKSPALVYVASAQFYYKQAGT